MALGAAAVGDDIFTDGDPPGHASAHAADVLDSVTADEIHALLADLAPVQDAAAHTEENTANNQYKIHDEGVLTGYGGPVLNPVTGDHVENPVSGENVFVPGANMGVTTGPNGEHQHVGNAVTYSIDLDGADDGSSRINANVEYDQRDPTPFPNPRVPSANLDMYLYGPQGDIVSSHTGSDGGTIGVGGNDLPEGSYTALLVSRYGAAPYDTEITVTD
jgi:hypothetical protein